MKKLLIVLLSTLMIMGSFAMNVLAETETYSINSDVYEYTSLEEALKTVYEYESDGLLTVEFNNIEIEDFVTDAQGALSPTTVFKPANQPISDVKFVFNNCDFNNLVFMMCSYGGVSFEFNSCSFTGKVQLLSHNGNHGHKNIDLSFIDCDLSDNFTYLGDGVGKLYIDGCRNIGRVNVNNLQSYTHEDGDRNGNPASMTVINSSFADSNALAVNTAIIYGNMFSHFVIRNNTVESSGKAISYDVKEGSWQKVISDEEKTFTGLNEYEKDGSELKDGATGINLYVSSVVKYTVIYDLNGGERSDASEDLEYSVKGGENTPLIADPVKDGYQFIGWNPEIYETVNEDMTYVAKWKENKKDPIPPVDPVDWDVSKNKTAEKLDENGYSRVTLSLPSDEEELVSDVLFVLDGSSCEDATLEQFNDEIKGLYDAVKENGANVRVGLVLYKGTNRTVDFVELDDDGFKTIIEEAKRGPNNSAGDKGGNMEGALISAERMLDNSSTPDNRKYMVLISDGIAYSWDENGKHFAAGYVAGGMVQYASNSAYEVWHGDDGSYFFHPDNDDWTSYLTDDDMVAAIENTRRECSTDFTRDTALIKQNDIYCHEGQNSYDLGYASTIDVALYDALNRFNSINSKYHCIAVALNPYKFQYGYSFMNHLGVLSGHAGLKMSDIHKEIIYLVDKGSYVTDIMGKDFDFVNKMETMDIVKGGEKLDKVELSDNEYGFGKMADGYQYVITYDETTDTFIWNINVPVGNFEPVCFTYLVKLSTKFEPGKYVLPTNESAVLTPYDSRGNKGEDEPFPIPTVDYEVKAKPKPPVPVPPADDPKVPVDPPVTPEPKPVPTPTPDPVPVPDPSPDVNPPVDPNPIVPIEDDVTPTSDGLDDKAWALMNLVLTVLTLILGVVALVMKKNGDDSENDEETIEKIRNHEKEDDREPYIRRVWPKFVDVIVFVLGALVFIFTENMKLPMRIIDKFTIIHLILFVASLIFTYLGIQKLDNTAYIEFDLMGGNGEIDPIKGVGEEENRFPFPTSVPVKEGYTFVGWNEYEDGSGEMVNSFDEEFERGTTTYYAQYKKNK